MVSKISTIICGPNRPTMIFFPMKHIFRLKLKLNICAKWHIIGKLIKCSLAQFAYSIPTEQFGSLSQTQSSKTQYIIYSLKHLFLMDHELVSTL